MYQKKRNKTFNNVMIRNAMENRIAKVNRPFYKICVAAVTGLLLFMAAAACEDALLDQKPRGSLTLANFFETEQHAIEATNATYERLRTFNFTNFLWLGMTDIASDDANKGSTPGDGPPQRDMDEWTFSPSSPHFGSTWRDYYQGIFRANLALENIPDIDMDDALKQRLIGENKFLRAHLYFFLVRAYGGVPLITAPQSPDEFRTPRATAEDIYTLIEKDLQDAIDVLPEKSEYAPSDMGRATKGAAQAKLAKVLLYQEKYPEAEQAARDVINSGEYSLYPDYERIFQRPGENSSESIFEVQAVAVDPPQGGTEYSMHQAVRGQPNMGWGFNNPSDELLNTYEPGDPRLGATVLFVHETLPVGTPEIVRHNTQMLDNQRYNQKSVRPLDEPGNNPNSGTNIRVIRYSDLLLIAAEAAWHNGNEPDARDWVNEVRARARGGQTATIGIEEEAVSSLVADTLGDPSLEGRPLVRYVTSGGPADAEDIRQLQWTNPGETDGVLTFGNVDIIQSVDGVAVSTPEEFQSEMNSKNPGEIVALQILRIEETPGSPKSRTTQNLLFTVTTVELLPDVTAGGQDLLEAIWHERRVELAMEQHRMWDLRRTGRAGEILRALGKNFEDNKHELYPIPADELQLNPELNQNTGY